MAGRGRVAAVAIVLSDAERRELEGLAGRRKTAQGLARRARIVLSAAAGLQNKQIVERLGIDANTVSKWRRRFAERRCAGLYDEPRSGAPRKIGDDAIAETIRKTLEETPPDATHWSLRSMARATGYAPSTIHRLWKAFALQPHRSETFKLSTDPLFVDKVRDIVGLYLAPPERALVLCVDEKSQIQALDRSQPLLPMRPGQPERRTHDYKRHGTTSLFAALDVATGKVIGKCYARHRAKEFLSFLRQIDRAVPNDLEIHLVMDNYATHKTAAIRSFLAKRPHWHVHLTPTGASPPRPAGRVPCKDRIKGLLAFDGSIRSSDSLPISPRGRSGAVSIARRKSCNRPSRPTSPPSTPTPNRSAGPSPPRTSSMPCNDSACALSIPQTNKSN